MGNENDVGWYRANQEKEKLEKEVKRLEAEAEFDKESVEKQSLVIRQLREALEPMRQLIVSLKENGSSHAFFIMQQAWGDLDWDEVVEMMDSLLEVFNSPKGPSSAAKSPSDHE